VQTEVHKLYFISTAGSTGCNRTRLQQGRFSMATSKHFFILSLVNHWYKLPGEAVGLQVFKRRLQEYLSELI